MDAPCVDYDGDGWGWNGVSSCLVSDDSAGSGSSISTVCVDDDGDGWGWNGESSCRADGGGNSQPSSGTSGSGAICVDDDGDGWGWDGTRSCEVASANATPVTGSDSSGAVCADPDGDGWGWNGTASCRSDSGAAQPLTPNSGNQNAAGGESPPVTVSGRFNTSTDLLAAHFDHGPDPDDGHAAAAARVIDQVLGLDTVVVGGTTGEYSAGRYLPESENLMRQIFGGEWLDGHNNRSTSAEQAARRWVATMAAGGDIWVAEGGPSDFTAAVVRIIRNNYPEYNTRSRVHVVQHSQWNEDHALRSDLNYVKNNTNYIRIEDGNDPNSTADLRLDGYSPQNLAFVQTARASRFAAVWNHAFNYLDPNEKLDFSDTVEVLYILNIGLGEIRDVTDFGRYFLQR